MSRVSLSTAIVAGLLSSQAWALPPVSPCQASGRGRAPVLWAPVCTLAQDPWQDCDEDPWQLSLPGPRRDDRFSDPWQDGVDPWQPVFAVSAAVGGAESDPWQPLVGRAASVAPTSIVATATNGDDDPWQPAFADPWQDGVDDPWQLP